jgi:hypothetical protein
MDHCHKYGQGFAEDEAEERPRQQRDAQVRAPTQARQRRPEEGR